MENNYHTIFFFLKNKKVVHKIGFLENRKMLNSLYLS